MELSSKYSGPEEKVYLTATRRKPGLATDARLQLLDLRVRTTALVAFVLPAGPPPHATDTTAVLCPTTSYSCSWLFGLRPLTVMARERKSAKHMAASEQAIAEMRTA